MLKMWGYMKCGTCRKAIKDLEAKGQSYEFIDITEKPPAKKVLTQIVRSGDYELKQLFNTSGVQYRELKIKDKLPDMSQKDAIDLLSGNGKLIKRPIVTDGEKYTVGYKVDVFEAVWG